MYGYFIDRLKAAKLDIYAMEIYCGGETIYRYEVGKAVRYPIYSVTKSVTSAAFSIACAEGLLTAETPLSELLPGRYKKIMGRDFSRLPFKRFLTMTAGEYPFRPYGDDWLETCLSIHADFSDTSFHYSNIPAYFVSAALENAVGEPLIKYLGSRLLEPLGIPEPPYAKSPEGYFYGATGMSLSVSELAKLGILYLENGICSGRVIIPSEQIDEAVAGHITTNRGDGYGYFFRAADDHFSMVGKWGQRCIIYPKQKLVIAYLSHQPDRSEELYAAVNDFARSVTAPHTSL